MNLTLKRLTPLLGLLVLLAGCGKAKNPVAPILVPPLSSVTLSVHVDTLDAGQTHQFTAVALDTAHVPYTGALNWASSNEGVFVVGSTGLVTGVGEGTALLFVSGGGKADTASVLVYPTATGWLAQVSHATETLNGVFFDAAGRTGCVVGRGGVVLSTRDAGATWTRRTPTTFNLNGVWFTSALEGWAVGDVGTVLRTTDGGLGWTRIISDSTAENLRHVQFVTPDVGWVVGSGGIILKTTDGGDTWKKSFIQPLNRPTLSSVMFANANDGWAVSETGVIAGTHDGGTSWFVVQPSVTGQSLKALWRRSVEQSFAVGAQGAVLRTEVTPDSVAWLLGTAGGSNELEGVCFATDSIGYAVGGNPSGGVVLRSDHGGVIWTPQTANSQFRLRGVFFVDERRGWAVGDNGTIRHTTSGGE